jgi:hypothetical protein
LRELDPASTEDIQAYRAWVEKRTPIEHCETRFLERKNDLLAVSRRASVSPTHGGQPQSGLIWLPLVLVAPLLAFAIVPSLLGRLIVIALIGAGGLWQVTSTPELMSYMTIQEWSVAASWYVHFISPHVGAQWAVEGSVVATMFARAEHVFAGCPTPSRHCQLHRLHVFGASVKLSDALNLQQTLSLHRLYPAQVTHPAASRALDLFLRFTMVKLMHAAISGLWRSLRASCADKHGRPWRGTFHDLGCGGFWRNDRHRCWAHRQVRTACYGTRHIRLDRSETKECGVWWFLQLCSLIWRFRSVYLALEAGTLSVGRSRLRR